MAKGGFEGIWKNDMHMTGTISGDGAGLIWDGKDVEVRIDGSTARIQELIGKSWRTAET